MCQLKSMAISKRLADYRYFFLGLVTVSLDHPSTCVFDKFNTSILPSEAQSLNELFCFKWQNSVFPLAPLSICEKMGQKVIIRWIPDIKTLKF